MDRQRPHEAVIPPPELVPGTLAELECRLERIRQEQLDRSRSRLRGLTRQQNLAVELLTAAIIRKISEEVDRAWRASAATGETSRIVGTVSLVWGLEETGLTSSKAATDRAMEKVREEAALKQKRSE